MADGKFFFTTPDNKTAKLYTLTNLHGGIVQISNWGGVVTSLVVPDKNGELTDVVLGWRNPESYIANPGFLGALVGRVANRIAGGRFEFAGVTYQMILNDAARPNTLHGGFGLSRRLWQVAEYDEKHLVLQIDSPHGDSGFPGNLSIQVTYSWNDDFEFSIDYHVTTDISTPVNFTNHTYFNLNGEASNSFAGHSVRIDACEFTPVDELLIPSGVAKVGGDFPDLRKHIGFEKILQMIPDGLDHNYILGRDIKWRPDCVEVKSEKTGIALTVSTDRTGVQIYMGGFLGKGPEGKSGGYKRFSGFCLETQEWPDALNHPDFPSIILNPGEVYSARTIYRFRVDG